MIFLNSVSRIENIEFLAPLIGFGLGLIASFIFASITHFFLKVIIDRRREENIPLHYYNQHRSIAIKELRRKLQAKNKKAS